MVNILEGLALFGVSIATILMALASLLGTMTMKQAVELGMADARVLCGLTGVTNPRELQDIFGPPTMDRAWHGLNLATIEAERRPAGHLISDDRVDWICIGVAVVALFWRHPVADILLIVAATSQLAGWIMATRLPR
ncbi:hypothetical protein [Henriciella aquimarina]|uniref:hypothetical protein n=1 Tax=Henriciella aquimarina TaxID=545261 RepID=UPI000A00A5E4|nr:hypothetical protein [Henriciella aquimarina]